MDVRLACSLLAAALAVAVATRSIGADAHGVTAPPVATEPQSPHLLIDTSLPHMSGRILSVAAGEDLQAALDAANPGDTIVLQAGATYHGPFILPSKPGSAWVVLTGDAPARRLPAPGSRIDPAFADALPKLVASSDPIVAAPNSWPASAKWPSGSAPSANKPCERARSSWTSWCTGFREGLAAVARS